MPWWVKMLSISLKMRRRVKSSGIVVRLLPIILHEISYNGEEEHCYFDLIQDLIVGDLICTL